MLTYLDNGSLASRKGDSSFASKIFDRARKHGASELQVEEVCSSRAQATF